MGTEKSKIWNDTWSIEMWYEGGPHHVVKVDLPGDCSWDDVHWAAEAECKKWIRGGDCGIEGSLIEVFYKCTTERWDTATGRLDVEFLASEDDE